MLLIAPLAALVLFNGKAVLLSSALVPPAAEGRRLQFGEIIGPLIAAGADYVAGAIGDAAGDAVADAATGAFEDAGVDDAVGKGASDWAGKQVGHYAGDKVKDQVNDALGNGDDDSSNSYGG